MDWIVPYKMEGGSQYGRYGKIEHVTKQCLHAVKQETDLSFGVYGSVYPVKIESEFDAGVAVIAQDTSVKAEEGRMETPDKYSFPKLTGKIPNQRKRGKDMRKDEKSQTEVEAELADIAASIRRSNKTSAELLQEFGPRLKKLWKASSVVAKKPYPKSKAERMRDYRTWIKSLGAAGNPIAKLMAERAAEYTRNRRERIKILAEAGDPTAMVMFARLLENRRKYIERRKALREAGGPIAEAMAERAREYTRKRTHRIKALAEAGDPVAKAKVERILESRRKYIERRRALRAGGGTALSGYARKCTVEGSVGVSCHD